MADQDFNIKVVTTADTAGIREVDAGLDKIARRQAEAEAKWARSPINPINQRGAGGGGGIAALGGPTPPSVGGDTAGLTGTAVGIGTIITLLTASINKIKQFEDEQDQLAERMMKATERSHELGLAVADMLDAMKSAERIDTEPLEVSFDRLRKKVGSLKTEIQIAFKSGDYEGVKKLVAALGVVESQFNRVTTAIDNQAAAKKRAAQSELDKRVPGLKPDDQVKESDAQTQAILKNEQAAAKARAEGNERDADLFQKSADQYKASATPKQLADLQRIHDLQDQLAGKTPAGPTRQPEPGEPGGGEEGTGGPSLKGEQAKQQRDFERQKTKDAAAEAKRERDESNAKLRGENRAGNIEKQTKDPDLAKAIQDLSTKMDRYWA